MTAIAPVGQFHNNSIDSLHHKVKEEDNVVTVLALPDWPAAGSAAGSLRASAQALMALSVRTDQLGNYPDVLDGNTLDTMESRPFPDVTKKRALGWQISCRNSGSNPCYEKKLYHNGESKYGTSYMAKFKNYSVSKNGLSVTVNDINVAVISNSGNTDLGKLKDIMDRAAWIAAKESVPTNYDLFQANPK